MTKTCWLTFYCYTVYTCVVCVGAQHELRLYSSRRARGTLVSNQSSSDVASVGALPLSVDGFQRSPQRYSASATRLYVNDCTSAGLRSGDPTTFGTSLRRRDVAHRGSLLSMAVLLSGRQSSCPVVFDDASTRSPVSDVVQNCSWCVSSNSCNVYSRCIKKQYVTEATFPRLI